MNDLLTDYLFQVRTEMNENTEKVVLEFLKKEGYELERVSHETLTALERILAAQNKKLRVEIFYKFTGDYNMQYLVIPFFEPVDVTVDRIELYKMLRLADQGYQI